MNGVLRRIGFWLFDHVPLGPLAPRVFGWLIGAKGVRRIE